MGMLSDDNNIPLYTLSTTSGNKTAHKLKMSGYGENSFSGKIADSLRVSGYSEGETSISFSTGQSANLQVDAEYALTTYGLEFLTLRRNAIIPIISAGEGPPHGRETY